MFSLCVNPHDNPQSASGSSHRSCDWREIEHEQHQRRQDSKSRFFNDQQAEVTERLLTARRPRLLEAPRKEHDACVLFKPVQKV